MKSERGFTLIELLVVISIIALLSSVVLASLSGARTKGRDARRIADLKQIQTALELFYNETGNYPDCLYVGNNDAGSPCGTTLDGSGHIPSVPLDPRTGLQYSYAHTSVATGVPNCTSHWTYHLGASLEIRTNPALASDTDATRADVANGGRCTGLTNYDFFGLSAAVGGQKCNFVDGTVSTETCYDLRP